MVLSNRENKKAQAQLCIIMERWRNLKNCAIIVPYTIETQMILNHKAAIELLINNIEVPRNH